MRLPCKVSPTLPTSSSVKEVDTFVNSPPIFPLVLYSLFNDSHFYTLQHECVILFVVHVLVTYAQIITGLLECDVVINGIS